MQEALAKPKHLNPKTQALQGSNNGLGYIGLRGLGSHTLNASKRALKSMLQVATKKPSASGFDSQGCPFPSPTLPSMQVARSKAKYLSISSEVLRLMA